MMIARILMASLLTAFAGNSVAGEESFIDMKFEAATPANAQPASMASHCDVLITPPHDMRLNKDTLGSTFRDNPIISKQPVAEWLQQALLSMDKLGLHTTLAAADSVLAPNATLVTTDLQKLYLWYHSMNLQGTLVVKATMQTGTAAPTQHYYRIIGSKLNWVNGDSEYVSTFNIAAQRLLNQMAADISKQCKV